MPQSRCFAAAGLAVVAGLLGAAVPPALTATVYEVGPGKPLASIGQVPWATLQPGDTVLIYWRPAPYKEKWVICRQGSSEAPITVRGVPGPEGQSPVIDGDGAVTAPGLNYWSEVRGVVKIGGANVPADLMPRHIVVENFEIINARPPYTFTDDAGSTQAYTANASGIYLEKGEHISIGNCIFRDNGNGLFVASSDSDVSRDILIRGNYLYNNGNDGSLYEHNSYTAAIGIVFEHNRYGPLRLGALGNNLKDRSAGLVVRYNWIEGGNRQLDLVDGEDSVAIRSDPAYRETHVYGNVLIEPESAGNRQILHYGGDSGNAAGFRKGTLYFYNNTVVSTRTDRNTIFRLSTNDERCDARNNLVYTTLPGSDLSLLDTAGVLDLSHNWIKPGWRISFGSFHGTVNDDGTMVEGTSPGFVNEAVQDYHLTAQSQAVDAGGLLAPDVLPGHDVVQQYVKHRSAEPRPRDGLIDIGAFEYSPGTANQPPIAIAAAMPTSGTAPLAVDFDGSGSYDPDGVIRVYGWDFGDGEAAGGAVVQHTYPIPGTFLAKLTVTDDGGASSTDSVEIVVQEDSLVAPVLSGSASGGTVTLTWTHPANTDGYYLERGAKVRGKVDWAPLAAPAAGETSYTDTVLRGTYYYRVQAFRQGPDGEELSPYSNEVVVRTR